MKKSVIAVVYTHDRSKLLCLKRCDVPVWVIPGGGVDAQETPEAAVLREINEETGIHAVIVRKVAVYSPLNKLSNETHFFECLVKGGNTMVGPETREVDFFPLNALPQPFFFLHLDWLRDALENQTEVIYKNIHQVTYLAFFRYCLFHPIQVLRLILSRLGFPMNSHSPQ